MMVAMNGLAEKLRWGLWMHLALIGVIAASAYLGWLPIWQLFKWPYADKVMHFLLVGGIAFWVVGGWGDRRLRLGALSLPLAVTVPLLLAALEEGAQAFSPRRNADVADLAADAAGLVVFWLVGRGLLSKGLLGDPEPKPNTITGAGQ